MTARIGSPERRASAARRNSVPLTTSRSSLPRANCRFDYGVAQSLELPDAAFDVVTCTFGMHHIPEADRGRALAERSRVLRPGGRGLLADMAPGACTDS
ncbi:class I SAM-dependent methyltransferase [Nocardia sp. BSTN01]|nr:class I SAM-dependent methyltransferase [Nocardia sp. BSTN01]